MCVLLIGGFMLVAFLIMLREGIEAALIVGIIASYLKYSGRTKNMPAMWLGIGLAVLLCSIFGLIIHKATGEIPQKQQELFVGLIGLIATAFLTTMVFWMKKAAYSIKSQIHESIEKALSHGKNQTMALIVMSFLAVMREGLESVFFLIAAFEQGRENGALIGAILGIIASILFGYGIYQGGIRLNLTKFFKWTGCFIIIVAAGLLASSLRALHEAGIWNQLQTVVFDWSQALSTHSILGVFLSGVLGYNDRPTIGEVLIWLIYLVPALIWYFKNKTHTK